MISVMIPTCERPELLPDAINKVSAASIARLWGVSKRHKNGVVQPQIFLI
jgi:hypothetical protein